MHEKSHCNAVSMIITASKVCMDVGIKLRKQYEGKKSPESQIFACHTINLLIRD